MTEGPGSGEIPPPRTGVDGRPWGPVSMTNLQKRIARIQRRLGVRPDGHVGPVTVSALEEALDLVPSTRQWSLEVSRSGIDQLVRFEVGSRSAYERSLRAPYWPGGESGVTVGIGYDLGFQTAARIESDFRAYLTDADLGLLQSAVGVKGDAAEALAGHLRAGGVRISFEVANRVFLEASLPRYAHLTRKAYPGIHHLPADAQAMLLSLVYNRGSSLTGDRRREMRAIAGHVRRGDLSAIATELRAMKRLWDPDELPGLLRRRDREARLVEEADHPYAPGDRVRV